jgi:crotonobetainyl-CoA:carnitine CoA-transferase CaiB-like acyl-CoA transferase
VAAVDALRGTRVLERDTSIAARYCGRLLAQLGAHVVAVRTADAIDDAALGPSDEAGIAYGRWLDEGKRLTDEAPNQGFDVVLGAGDEAPTRVRLSWFGHEGPDAGWHATDEIVLAAAGLAHAFGPREGPPTLARGHTHRCSPA